MQESESASAPACSSPCPMKSRVADLEREVKRWKARSSNQTRLLNDATARLDAVERVLLEQFGIQPPGSSASLDVDGHSVLKKPFSNFAYSNSML